MKNKSISWAVTGTVALSLLAAAACSDSNDTSPIAPNPTPVPSDAAVADSATPALDTGAPDAAPDSAVVSPRFVYVESNITTPGGNSIFAFAQASDGTLTALAGSPFPTGGTGVGNPTQALGPDDGDQQIVLSADGKQLFAVNAGSNTIAVFAVKDDGSLAAIAHSPFASGGIDPISIGLAGDHAIVVNQAEDPAQAGAGTPGYVSLPLAADGTLGAPGTPVAAGKSPQVALVTADHTLLFGLDFMAPLANSQGPIRSFVVGAGGTLTSAPGTPLDLPVVDGGMPPGTPLALGLALHPTQKVLYVGYVLRSQIGVYTYGADGSLTYVANAPVTGKAPCWIRVNAKGDRAYVTDTATNSVSVLDLSTPLAPTEIQHIVLSDLGPIYDGGTSGSPTSQAYEENLSPDGKYLFVLSQNTNPDPSVTVGNNLHVLTVAADGKLSETVPEVKLPVPAGVRPQGVVIR